MLLLGLVGVNKDDIISNYTPSYNFICSNPDYKKECDDIINQEIQKAGKSKEEVISEFMKWNASPPEKIRGAIDYIINNYGTFEKYLFMCGISPKNLDEIKDRFLESPKDI